MDEMDPVVDQGNDEELIKPELKLDSPRWYEGHISLEDAKTFIKANITTAARSFIAIGFYLKCVRDRNLFLEEDYPDVWEFAKSEYGISKSTASRYMSMNDRFSERGNSPNIRDEYRAFGKSQLQEMLYLEDDQLEQVKPGDRVEDIRNLRKPKEVPYIELPGQLDFEIDFPEILPQEPPMISQKQTFEMDVEDMLSDEKQEGIAISQQELEVERDSFKVEDQEEQVPKQSFATAPLGCPYGTSDPGEPESLSVQHENISESPETVIDGEFVEVVEVMPWPEPVKPEQPELPILKNNDQRKDFIDSYDSWPIWIDQKETGERYHRYDLSKKVAMVVKVSWKHAWGNYKESKDYEYGAEQYYLLGIEYEWHNGKNTYKEDETRTFYECSTNKSALVDYLRDFQKNK